MNNIVIMALNLKTKNIMSEKITIRTTYVNTSEAPSVQWEGKLHPYYEQLNNTNSELKYQKASEYFQMRDRQDPTYHMYENNIQTVQRVLQEMKQINHLESKLPVVFSSNKNRNRYFKIGIGLLGASCCILVVALIYVAVSPSTITPCTIDPCQNRGTFTYSINSSQPSCECRDGFSGNNCQVPPCTNSPCQNHGKCNILESGYNCTCVDWFSGENCTDYMCDFELNDPQLCVFEQKYSHNRQWQRRSGSIPRINVPIRAADGKYYNSLFADYNPASTVPVRFVSRNIILDSAKCLSFKYYLYGLHLKVYTNRNISLNLFGYRAVNYWRPAIILVPVETNKITFEATYVGYNYPYAAIDSVKISDCLI